MRALPGAPEAARHAGPGSEASSGRPPHLHSVDVVRLTTVVGVIAVHCTSLMLPDSWQGSGAVLVLLHVTREIFLLLSAFVLTYSARGAVANRRSFWRKRYPLVLAPYIAWSVIYVLADGDLRSPLTVLGRIGLDVLDGAAKFHLYFLLLTFQLYLVFPWVLDWLRRHRRHHGRILAASLAFQVAFTAAAHYRLHVPVLSTWLYHPGTMLPSYSFYVIAGILAALHFEEVTSWVDSHRRQITVGAMGAAVLGVGWYLIDLKLVGMSPVRAGEVFQPCVAIESVAFMAGQLALGGWIAERSTEKRLAHLRWSSDVSFGVYLSHPLLMQVSFAVAGLVGLSPLWRQLPEWAGIPLALFVAAPAYYLAAACLVGLARRTFLSLPLTGRPAPRRPTRFSGLLSRMPLPLVLASSPAAAPLHRGRSQRL